MQIHASTQKGPYKSENEDRIIVGSEIISSGGYEAGEAVRMFAIADGVGGNNAGAIASQFVASALAQAGDSEEINFTAINNGLLELSHQQTAFNGMATTLSGIRLCDAAVVVFSVGNTRVYLLQGGRYLKQITQDDTTLSYLLSTGQLTQDDAYSFERKNEITACFGGGNAAYFKLKTYELGGIASPFVITSDGIHDYLSADQMEDILEEYGLTILACEKMISTAREMGSQDDASIMIGEI